MRHYSKVFKRVQAWVLIVAMLLPILNCGLFLGVFAEGETNASLTDGQIVAENYELTKAEKVLLSSGLLVGDTHSIYYPTANDDLVTVDQDNKKITAESYDNKDGNKWIPVSADIVADGATQETVNLVDGVGTYTYDGNAFSVNVLYRLSMKIDEDTQTALLNAAGYLKQGLANMNTISKDTGLGTVELAMDVLNQLANGISMDFGAFQMTAQFKEDAIAAVRALNKQYSNNGNKLLLGLIATDYSNATSKTQYICEHDVSETFLETYNCISAIKADPLMNNELLDGYLQGSDPANHTRWMAFKGIIDNWIETMTPIAEDAWAHENATIVEDNFENWVALDLLVADIDTVTANTVKNPLVAAETTIQVNMSMFNVTINVLLKVAGTQADKLVAVNEATKTDMITLVEGAPKADILAAIVGSGVESAAKAAWGQYGFVDGQFEAEASALPDALTDDLTYTITYSPKSYTISANYPEAPEKAYYGYMMILPECLTANRVYDYTVNGESFYQGDLITITGDTEIVRADNKAYDLSQPLSKVVSKVYANVYICAEDDKKPVLSDDAVKILTSGALTVGNEVLQIRYPDNKLTLAAGKLTAPTLVSGYEGLSWVPTTYKLVGGTNNGKTGDIVNGQADLTGMSYEQVVVSYELALTNFSNEKILELVNLPYVLYQEAQEHTETLERLAAYTTILGQLDKTKLGALKGVIDVTDGISNELKTEFKEIVDGILDGCVDSNNMLKMYNLLVNYDNEKLTYYYRNHAAFRNELAVLSDYLDAMVGTEGDGKVEALQTLTAAAGFAEYADKITDAQGALASVRASLTKPNVAIDTAAKNLSVLTAALTAADADTFKKYNTLPADFALTETVSIQAEGKQTATIVLYGPNDKRVEITKVFEKGVKLSALDIAELKAEVKAAVASWNLPVFFYNTDYDADQLLVGFEGADPSSVNLTYEWWPKTFTVQVPDAANQTISIDDLTIDLPAADSFGVRYEYTIGSKTGLTGSYTFTLDEVQTLFVNDSYTVSRTVVDLNKEGLITFVNGLNADVNTDIVSFALTEKNGAYAIVMKLNAAQPDALAGAMQEMVMAFYMNDMSYSYIGLDKGGVLEDSKVSIQAIIDAIMASGFSTNDLINAINENGSVNNMVMPGAVLAGNMKTAGGKLIETTMSVGNSKADSQKLGFYITLGSAAGEIVELRNLLAGRLSNYLQFICVDGKATVQMTLPEKAYQAYLAALLVTGELDIRNINAANGEIAIGFVKDFINPMFVGDVTLETVNNTLNVFGYDLDLTEYENLYAKLCEQYEKTEVVYDEKSGHATRTFPIKALVDRMNIPSTLASAIKEYETGITLKAAVSVENLANEYEALFVDVRAEGATNKIGLTKDLSDKLNNLSGASIIVLMSDVEGDLVLPYTTVLNLNGFTVTGSVKCTGKVTIVDSSLMETEVGRVTGTVTGNATILGGQFDSKDIAAFIKPGYTQDDNGVVGNEFYSFVKDANGDITIQIDAGIAATDTLPDIKSMVIDLAVDMLFNGYTTNSLYINNHKVYEMVMDDFLGIYTGENRLNTLVHNVINMVDSNELAAIVNQLATDLTDFEALQNAILNDQPVISYPMTTGDWAVVMEHATDGDYLTISVTTSNSKNRNLYVKFVGSQEDKDLLADLMGALKDTTDVEIEVDLDHGFASSNDKNLVLDWSGFAKVNVNFSNNYDYAVMFSVLLADGNTGATREALVNAIKTYYATGEISEMMAAFNAVTTSEAIKAVKNIYKNDTFGAMLDNLGLTDVVYADVAELEAIFDTYVKIVAAVVRKTDVVGGNRTLGSFYNKALGGYGFSKSNFDKTFARELFKGYSVTLNVDISEVTVVINIFGDAAPYVVDYTELKDVIANAEALDDEMYAVNTWNAMQAVLANAKALLNNASKQEQVDNMVDELNAAIDALVDISVLKTVIAYAEGLNPDDYTSESWDPMWEILVEAKELLINAPDQVTVNNMTAMLTAAIDELDMSHVEVLVYDKLIALIKQVESLEPSEYTVDSWNAVWVLYEEAVALLNNAVSQDEIDALVADLAAAIANLLRATIEGVFVPDGEKHENLAGIKLHEDDLHIIIDAHGNGLSADVLLNTLEIDGSIGYNFVVESVGEKLGVVYTGAEIVVGIYKDGERIGERVFTAVVLGDIDGDGRANAKDANLMVMYFTGSYTGSLTESQEVALDTNCDGKFNARDAQVISHKFVYWDEYTTFVDA